jgi:anti-sigma factor RsiW
MPHVNPDQLEQYVLGTLEGGDAAALEAHAASCESCALALQREARLELGLQDLAALPTPAAARPAPRRRVRVAVATFFAAAAALGLFAWPSAAPSPSQAPAVRRCDEATAPSDCVARAQFDGVLTIGPDRQVVVPRYDETGAP